MANNDQIVLETILRQSKQEQFPEEQISDRDFFNWFVSEQIMKDYELSYDEINEGIVDNGGDIQIFAKIEKFDAVENIDEILEQSDGLIKEILGL